MSEILLNIQPFSCLSSFLSCDFSVTENFSLSSVSEVLSVLSVFHHHQFGRCKSFTGIGSNHEYNTDMPRDSNCVTRFLKQFEAERIEAMGIGNLLTKIEEGSSSILVVLATI